MYNMQPRKITFVVGYIHILTFKEHIKKIVSTYFTYLIEYGIDNEGTMQENVRLVFKAEGFILQFNKEMSTLIYEGPIGEIRKNNPIVDIFFEIVAKIGKIDTFIKTSYLNLTIDLVGITEKDEYENLLMRNKYLINPFQKFTEFATLMEFEINSSKYRLEFGNFNESDIAKRAISPLRTKYNEELLGKFGVLAVGRVQEESKSPSFSKLKEMITEVINVVNKYLEHNE